VDNNGNVMEHCAGSTRRHAGRQRPTSATPLTTPIAWRLDGTEFADPAGAIYVAYNGWSAAVNFTLPWPGTGRSWYRVTDTATWNDGNNTVVVPGSETFIGG